MSTITPSRIAESSAPRRASGRRRPRPLRRFVPDTSTAHWAVSLARRPTITARRLGGLGAEARRILTGASTVAPDRKDRRFTDVAWTDNPLLKRLVQLYLTGGHTAEQLVIDADLEPRDRERVRFFLENLIEAAAPSNVPLVNPASAKAVIDTAGLSLVRGGKQLVKDLASAPRVPEMVDGKASFWARTSPRRRGGGLPHRGAGADPVHAPDRRRLRDAVAGGPAHDQQVLRPRPRAGAEPRGVRCPTGPADVRHLWRNPDSRHASWNLDTYVRAVLDALEAVEEITGSARTVLGGVCSGGILASMAAAYLAGIGRQDRLAALCLAVTVIDNDDAGTMSALVDDRLARRAGQVGAQGYLDGRTLAEVFAWLRPGDLVWNYWVNNYLLGKRPPAFDILFWNSDTTRMTAALHADFVDLAMENSLTQPGALTVLGVPMDLGRITVDSYVVAGIADHITPWESCYRAPSSSAAQPDSLCPPVVTSPPW